MPRPGDNFQVKRSHLKSAVETRNWDLLDRLLEIDGKHINDNNMFTDTWGEWWSMLLDCVMKDHEDGVRVLLKHGADKNRKSWGDGIPISPMECAKNKSVILKLLNGQSVPEYKRKSEPELLHAENKKDNAVNRQGDVVDETGMVFPPESFPDDD